MSVKNFNRFRLPKTETGKFILPLRGNHPARPKKFIKRKFIWRTPDTYDANFSVLPKESGVYALRVTNLETWERDIVYVGSSSNLYNRLDSGHAIIDFIKKKCDGYLHVSRLFIKCDNHLQHEIRLIKRFKPIFNWQHNG